MESMYESIVNCAKALDIDIPVAELAYFSNAKGLTEADVGVIQSVF